MDVEALDQIAHWRRRAQTAEAEREALRRKLTAHHAMHNLSSAAISEWAERGMGQCPVCREEETR